MVSKFTSAGAPLPDGYYVRSSDYDAALAKIETLKRAYADAIDDIESWAAYASDYFQDKHDLAGCLAAHRAALAAAEGATWSTQQPTQQSVLKDYTARECDETGQLYDVVYVDGEMRTRTLVVAEGEEIATTIEIKGDKS